MKTILVYGDSNTYGEGEFHRQRLPYAQRWVTLLEKTFPDGDIKVLPEGLSGRIAGNYKKHDVHTNGLAYFETIYRSHAPVNVVVIALGTNDSQPKYEQTSDMIADNLKHYAEIINSVAKDVPTWLKPQVLFVLPPEVYSREDYFVGDNEVIADLAGKFPAGTHVLQLRTTSLSDDGVHFSPEGHKEVAKKVFEKIKEIGL
jgi:lysophospholipase L1-like esterase